MTPIDKLTVSGFRGILSPLELPFRKGTDPTSMVIYGRNGTGKSSITDAWEWLHAGRIERLAREGAGETAYPHREASENDTFVEIAFSDPRVDPVRLTFNPSRVRTPKAGGDLATFRGSAPHPCHIRFGDLTDFVYFTKSERYDALARLMGFTPQVELQKAFRRTLRRLTEEFDSRKGKYGRLCTEMQDLLEPNELNDKAFLVCVNSIFSQHSLGSAKGLWEAETLLELLQNQVEEDPRAKELVEIAKLERACETTAISDDLWLKVEALENSALELGKHVGKIADLSLVDLYDKARRVLEDRLSRQETTGQCPVCGQEIEEPSLLEHLKEELAQLEELTQARDALVVALNQLKPLFRSFASFSSDLEQQCSDLELPVKEWPIEKFTDLAQEVGSAVGEFASVLDVAIGKIPEVVSARLPLKIKKTKATASEFEGARTSLLDSLRQRREELGGDEARTKLVGDYNLVRDGLKTWKQWKSARSEVEKLRTVRRRFEKVFHVFVEDSIADVQGRFTSISTDVD